MLFFRRQTIITKDFRYICRIIDNNINVATIFIKIGKNQSP